MFNSVLNWISEYFQWNDSLRKFTLTLLKSLPVACALLPLSSSAAIKCSRNSQMLNISTRTGTIIFSNYLIISFNAFCILDEHALSSGQTQWLHQPGLQPESWYKHIWLYHVFNQVSSPSEHSEGKEGEKGSYLQRLSYLLLALLSSLLELNIKTKQKNTLDWAGMIRGVTALMSHQDAYPQKCQHLTGCR